MVTEHAEQITTRFYPRMFAEHPELLRVFNKGNQATGEQSRALAGSVVAYAVQLIDPDAPSFDPVMRRIAGKHMSLGIRPEQYTIVGYNLLAAVADVLGNAVTPEIAEAWNEVYWLFAAQLIAAEARLYLQAGVDPAHPTRPYRVVRRIEEFIEAHWQEAITIERLAAEVGVSARAIFRAFERSRGYSPMAFAKAIRLKRAREILTSGDPRVSVTATAFQSNFASPSRFAKDYREAFGELPSETMFRMR